MKKLSALVVASVVGCGTWLSVDSAWAIKPFADEFNAMYTKDNPALAAEVEKVKCNVCHVGKNKKDRNAYGKALDELLDKKADAKDAEKIKAALEKVAQMPSNPADASSPKFGDLIKAGKLPGGA